MSIARIGGYNSISNRSISSNNFSVPEFPDSMTTKGQSKLSDGQIKDKLMEIARRDFAKGVIHETAYRSTSSEWLKLEQDYISYASPDRKGIINNTLAGYAKKFSMMMPNYNRKLNLLELLMQNSRLFGTRDIGNNFINFRDTSGNIIAMWNDSGWTDVPTDAELSRSHEFMQMTHDARVRAAQEVGHADIAINNAVSGFSIDLNYYLSRNSPFDMGKLASHGITYDAATGKTNVDKEKLQQATGRQIADKPTVGWNG